MRPRPGPGPGPRRAAAGGGRGGGGGPRASGDALVSPMQGTIIKIVAAEGQQVTAGDTVVVLEAMKMEQPLTAHKDGTVTDLAVEIGQTVSAGAVSASSGSRIPGGDQVGWPAAAGTELPPSAAYVILLPYVD